MRPMSTSAAGDADQWSVGGGRVASEAGAARASAIGVKVAEETEQAEGDNGIAANRPRNPECPNGYWQLQLTVQWLMIERGGGPPPHR
jgi:hypothetical protein